MALRSAVNRNLPPNLTSRKKTGRRYFSYRRPDTGAEHGMGTDVAAAVEAALSLNAKLMLATGIAARLEAQVMETSILFADYLARFVADLDTDPELKDSTRAEYKRRVKRIDAGLGKFQLEGLTLRQVAEFLDSHKPNARAGLRVLLSTIFKRAMSEGLMKENLAMLTRAKSPKRQRNRLDLDAFNAILEHAEPWMQRAFKLALITAQRCSDLVEMEFAHYQDGILRVEQIKNGARIAIKVDATLDRLIHLSRDNVPSPYIVHHKPQRRRVAADRKHWTQLSGQKLSEAFKDARNASGIFDHLSPQERPTFHEIRSLAADLYRKAGWSKEQIQHLLGHASASMTEVYLDGHEHWEVAETGSVVEVA